jgi:cytochrome c oxidase subunit 2
MPGRVTYLWFHPKKPGEHLVTCAEFCGVMHSYMSGKIVVMPPQEFEAWYAEEARKLAAATTPAPAAKPIKKPVARPAAQKSNKSA